MSGVTADRSDASRQSRAASISSTVHLRSEGRGPNNLAPIQPLWVSVSTSTQLPERLMTLIWLPFVTEPVARAVRLGPDLIFARDACTTMTSALGRAAGSWFIGGWGAAAGAVLGAGA